MKKFRYFRLSILLSLVIFCLGIIWSQYITTTGERVPDEGLEALIVIPIMGILVISGLVIDLYFMITGSNKPFIQKRKQFWQVMGVLAIFLLFYWIFVQATT